MGYPHKVKIIRLVWLVSSEGFEPVFLYYQAHKPPLSLHTQNKL